MLGLGKYMPKLYKNREKQGKKVLIDMDKNSLFWHPTFTPNYPFACFDATSSF